MCLVPAILIDLGVSRDPSIDDARGELELILRELPYHLIGERDGNAFRNLNIQAVVKDGTRQVAGAPAEVAPFEGRLIRRGPAAGRQVALLASLADADNPRSPVTVLRLRPAKADVHGIRLACYVIGRYHGNDLRRRT